MLAFEIEGSLVRDSLEALCCVLVVSLSQILYSLFSTGSYQEDRKTSGNVVARALKMLRTSEGNYCIKQRFSTITSLFKMGTSLKGKNLLPAGANSFL